MSDFPGGQWARHLFETPSPKSLGTWGHWKVATAGCTSHHTCLDLFDLGRFDGGGGRAAFMGSSWTTDGDDGR